MITKNPNYKFVKASLEPKTISIPATFPARNEFREDTGAPVDIITFNRDFLGRNLGGAQIEAYQAIWGINGNEWNQKYHEVALLVGMKGGKNFWCEGDVAYVCYFISCLEDPHEYFSKLTGKGKTFGYTKDKTFDIVNVSSVDENQARRSFFEGVKRVLTSTIDPISKKNWFEQHIGLDLREQFGDFTKREIVFPTRNNATGGIRLLSFNSTASAPEGLHILRFYMDEMSRADTKSKYKEAEALLNLGLNNTLASFPNRVGKTIGWSYPNNTDYDLTYERYVLSATQRQIYSRKYSTWEFNPSLKKEYFKTAYDTDPRTARRVYESHKGVSKENFFQPHINKLDQMVNPSLKNTVQYRQTTISRMTVAGEQTFTSAELISIKGDNAIRYFAYDASVSNDRFVILGGKVETRDLLKMDYFIGDTQEIISTNVKLIVDTMIVLVPTKDSPIDYIGIGSIFTKLLAAFPNTYSINSDHFQNEKLRQELIAKGISSDTFYYSNSMQNKLYGIMRTNIFNNNIEICNDNHFITINNKEKTISEALIWEGKTIIKDGNKIDHPKTGSKDLMDALAILTNDLLKAEVFNADRQFDIDSLDEGKLHELVLRFMKIEAQVEKEEFFPNQVLEEIAKRIGIPYLQIIPLAEYVQSSYEEYPYKGKNNFYAPIRFNDDIAKVRGYDDTTTYFYDPSDIYY